MPQNNVLNVSVAGVICQLKPEDEDYYLLLKNNYRYLNIASRYNPDVKLYIKKTDKYILTLDTNLIKETAILYFPCKRFCPKDLLFLTAVSIATLLIRKDIILLHASALEYNGKGFVFCGPSGVGKSTLVRLAKNYIPLSDDITVIKKEGCKYYVYPSPFDLGKCQRIGLTKALLKKIFYLKKSSYTKIKLLSTTDILSQVLRNNLISYIGYQKDKTYLYKSALDLIKKIPIHKLYFTKNNHFLSLL